MTLAGHLRQHQLINHFIILTVGCASWYEGAEGNKNQPHAPVATSQLHICAQPAAVLSAPALPARPLPQHQYYVEAPTCVKRQDPQALSLRGNTTAASPR